MTTFGNITIATVCDDHYTVMLAALLRSIERHAIDDETQITVYVVDDNISQYNKRRLTGSFPSSRFKIIWLKVSAEMIRSLEIPVDNSLFPLNIYYRLLLPELVPQEIERLIYLDVDMIFKKDIRELWSTDLQGNILGAVLDRSETVSNIWAGMKNFESLNLHKDTSYFNSGLLIIDVLEWRTQQITPTVFETIRENIAFADFPDQYGLNVVFANNWLQLDRRWNCQSRSVCEDPFIIHFTGRKPFYKSYSRSPDCIEGYREEFFSNLEGTAWKNFRPVTELERIFQKLRIQLNKRLTTWGF